MLNDKAKLTRIRAKLDEVFKTLGEEEGITFSMGRMTYDHDGSQCGVKVTMYSGSEEKEQSTRELERHSPVTLWGNSSPKYTKGAGTFKGSAGKVTVETQTVRTSIEADDVGKTFTVNGKDFTLVGFKPKGRKFRWIGADANGGNYKFQDDTLFPFALEWRK